MGLFKSRGSKGKSSATAASSSSSAPSFSPSETSPATAKTNNNTAVTNPERLQRQTQLLQKHGITERNSEKRPQPVHRLRSPLVKGINNDEHLAHEARETQGLVFEGKRNGFNLEFQATPVEKYNMNPHTRRDFLGTTNKTTGEVMEAGEKNFNGRYVAKDCTTSSAGFDGNVMNQPFTPRVPATRDAALKTLDRVQKEATTGNVVGNAFDSLQRQGRISFYSQPIFVRENGKPVLKGWT